MQSMGDFMENNKKKMAVVTGAVIVAIVGVIGVFFLNNSDSPNTKISYKILNSSLDFNHSLVLEYSNETIDPTNYITMQEGYVNADPTSIECNSLGDTEVTYQFTSNDGKKVEELKCIFTVSDTQGPVITFKDESVDVETMSGFDASANIISVEDSVDGSLAKVEEEPETIKGTTDGLLYEVGWYTVTINDKIVTVKASDNHGNIAEKSYSVNIIEHEPTTTTEATVSDLYYYPSVDINDGSDWARLSSHYDWYYTACTYLSGKYSTAQDALNDVIDHESDNYDASYVENNARIFMEKDTNGNVLYYQAGFEE